MVPNEYRCILLDYLEKEVFECFLSDKVRNQILRVVLVKSEKKNKTKNKQFFSQKQNENFEPWVIPTESLLVAGAF